MGQPLIYLRWRQGVCGPGWAKFALVLKSDFNARIGATRDEARTLFEKPIGLALMDKT